MGECEIALLRRSAYPVRRFKQPESEIAFEAGQPPRHGGFIDAQPGTGSGIGAFLGHGGDNAQVIPVHPCWVSTARDAPAISQPSAAIFLRERRPSSRPQCAAKELCAMASSNS